MLLYVLNQKYPELAVAEAKAASYGWQWWTHNEKMIDGTLLVKSRRIPKHLAFTRFAVKIIATCTPHEIEKTISAIRWKLPRYKVILTKQVKSSEEERSLAMLVWKAQKKPTVDVVHPQAIVDIVITATTVYIGLRVWENTENFENRRAHLRPEMHPSSMHPALARALVNIACVKKIHDPFCGSGGVLIEAGLAQVDVTGADIDPVMVARARRNCAAYHLHPELRVADATMWVPRVQAVIADLPYGKNTTPKALQPLIEAFLHCASQSTTRAIIGVPHEMKLPWKTRAHFSIYVHKSMTKHFYVVER